MGRGSTTHSRLLKIGPRLDRSRHLSPRICMTHELPESLRSLGTPGAVLMPDPKNWGMMFGFGIFGLVAGATVAILGALLAPPEERSYALPIGGAFLLGGVVVTAISLGYRTNRVFLFDDGFGLKMLGTVHPCRWDEVESTRGADARGDTRLFVRTKGGRKLSIQASEFRGGPDLVVRVQAAVFDHRGPEVRRAIDAGDTLDSGNALTSWRRAARRRRSRLRFGD